MSTPTTLPELVATITAANPRLAFKWDALANACNRYRVKTGEVATQESRPSAAIERGFAETVTPYVSLADLAAEPNRIAKQNRVFAEIKKAERGKSNSSDARSAIIDGILALIRDQQLEAFGVSLSDPDFGQDFKTVTKETFALWIDIHNGGNPVTREQVGELV